MIVKNLNKYFTFEVQVLDDKNVRRRFRASNYQARGPGSGVLYACVGWGLRGGGGWQGPAVAGGAQA